MPNAHILCLFFPLPTRFPYIFFPAAHDPSCGHVLVRIPGTGGRLIKLEVGQPDFAAPATAVKATQEAAAEQLHQGYIPNAGTDTVFSRSSLPLSLSPSPSLPLPPSLSLPHLRFIHPPLALVFCTADTEFGGSGRTCLLLGTNGLTLHARSSSIPTYFAVLSDAFAGLVLYLSTNQACSRCGNRLHPCITGSTLPSHPTAVAATVQ